MLKLFCCFDESLSSVEQSSCGRALLGLALRRLAENEPFYRRFGQMKISVAPNGKPYFEGGGLHFNISHSGGLVVCAVSSGEVGVDAERARENLFAVERKLLTAEEIGETESLRRGDKLQLLLTRWVMSEAFYKLTGEGLKGVLKERLITERLSDALYKTPDGARLHLFGVYGCCVCAATHESGEPELIHVKRNELLFAE